MKAKTKVVTVKERVKDLKTKNYELMVVLKPLLPDDIRRALHKDLLDQVALAKGEVLDVDVWGKRYLAYDIKGHNEGYYINYTFSAQGNGIAEMKRKLGLKPEILRFMIVEMEHPELIGKGIKKKEIEAEI